MITKLLAFRNFIRNARAILQPTGLESQTAPSSSIQPQKRDGALYRLYLFGHLNRIIGFVELKCQSDAEARDHAQRLASDGRYELWSQGNLLATTEPRYQASGFDR